MLNWRLNRAHSQALRDPLTGLPNRVLLDDRIEQALPPLAALGRAVHADRVDLDGFKDVNDVRGHRAGDLVLKSLARRFEAIVREIDTVARVGGDEFVILSMGTGSDDRAGALVGRLRHALRRPFRVDGAAVEIDGSIGWSVFPTTASPPRSLLARADGQMYATKRDTSDESVLLRRGVDAGIVRDVESALEQNELVVVYQPILDARRWRPALGRGAGPPRLPDGGSPPAEFVPHVERTPLVRELTFLVVADALARPSCGRSAGHDLGVSINIPYRLLDDPQFVEGLAEMLRTVDPSGPRSRSRSSPPAPARGPRWTRRSSRASTRSASGSRSTTPAAPPRSPRCASSRSTSSRSTSASSTGSGGARRTPRSSAASSTSATRSASRSSPRASRRATRGTSSRSWGCDYAQGFYVASPRRADELIEWLGAAGPRWPDASGQAQVSDRVSDTWAVQKASLPARLPERLLVPVRRVRGAREDEQEIREPVEIDERQWVQRVRPPQRAPRARRGDTPCARRAAQPPPRSPRAARSSSAPAARR